MPLVSQYHRPVRAPPYDEVKKFETAFKDPEFKKLFLEYAQEISARAVYGATG